MNSRIVLRQVSAPVWATDPAGSVDQGLVLQDVDPNGTCYYAHRNAGGGTIEFAIYDFAGNLKWVQTMAQTATEFGALGLRTIFGTIETDLTAVDIKVVASGSKLAICVTIQGRLAMAVADLPGPTDTSLTYLGWCWVTAGNNFYNNACIHEFKNIDGENMCLAVEAWDYTSADTYVTIFPSVDDIATSNPLYIGAQPTSTASFGADECAWIHYIVETNYGHLLLPNEGAEGAGNPSYSGWAITRVHAGAAEWRLYWKRGECYMDYAAGGGSLAATFCNNNYAAYPDGAAFYTVITATVENYNFNSQPVKSAALTGSGTICKSQFVAADGVTPSWFSQEGVRIYDGAPPFNNPYTAPFWESKPWTQELSPGRYLVFWSMADNDSYYFNTFGVARVYARLCGYLYDSTADKFAKIGEISGLLWQQGDLGKTLNQNGSTTHSILYGATLPIRYNSGLYIGGGDQLNYDWLSQFGVVETGRGLCRIRYGDTWG